MTLRDLVDNLNNGTMEDALKGAIEESVAKLKQPPSLDIASGYFNLGGFALVADGLSRLCGVRLLLGAEPPLEGRVMPVTLGERSSPGAERKLLDKQLALQEEGLKRDRDLTEFSAASETQVERLIAMQRAGKLRVRRFKHPPFLHAKAFILSNGEGVFVGSSNFTYAGLRKNLELNVSRKDSEPYEKARRWFEDLWNRSEEYDLASLYADRFVAHDPWVVYMRALYERYGHQLEEEHGALSQVELTTFQSDGVERARRILEAFNGVLIADSVGLGKSFVAARLIEDARRLRQRVLMIAPAALRDGTWARFMDRTDLRFEVRSYEELAQENLGVRDWSEYAMVVVDEAHGVRNPDADRSKALRKLLRGDPPKKLVMLTATPVNNSVWDLFYLLEYFIKQDAAFAGAGIRSMRELFKQASRMDPDDLTPDLLFELLDRVVVRRTRHFVKKFYPHDRIKLGDGKEIPIEFPKPHVNKLGYELNALLPGFFDEFERLVMPEDGEPELRLARYQPSAFRKDGETEQSEIVLVGLVRSGMLKRFESSIYAFRCTLERMVVHHRAFLDMLSRGRVATTAALDAVLELPTSDSDEAEFALKELENEGELEDARRYDIPKLREAVSSDLAILENMLSRVRPVTAQNSPKLKSLVKGLETIARQADKDGRTPEEQRNNRKVLIFTYFADTMHWIYDFLELEIATNPKLKHFKGRMAKVSSMEGTEAVFGFAPLSMDAPPNRNDDRFDILVTTDVLAEGMNLQQCRNLINYDLPWNPMRLVQRHGRIDRIGSPHKDNFIFCFLPDDELDRLLRLHDRIQNKVKVAARTVGVESPVLPGAETGEVVLGVREELERIKNGDASLLEAAGEREAPESGEEFRQELRAALKGPRAREITEFPWTAGSALKTPHAPGFFFCARVGSQSLFRFVSADSASIDDRVLTCLRRIRCPESARHVVTEGLRARAYEAWAVARRHILSKWNEMTDPANLQPKIPPSMQKAADVVRTHPDPGWAPERIADLVARLQAPHGHKVQRPIQEVLREHEEAPQEAARRLSELVEELGLQPYQRPKPLDVISEDNIHLVCWMALVNK